MQGFNVIEDIRPGHNPGRVKLMLSDLSFENCA
ncbi:hypothetical protein EHW99_2781 [Erwinia amylovora]|nr:hypothetical protein EHX00_2781 [Erwinia amylovora]QJQ59180.1 hypothetical protein EHW99_2781 [Erwinia amylovora]QJQ62879.1 hypothetical protein EHW98_2781 [Erwinia amylovora]QJQ66681.1 hypothetical protein EHW96_2781 [Erwinia amylovora]QJQ70380.1 hypothetical protein EGZ89_2781 [Erwinia amylovora]